MNPFWFFLVAFGPGRAGGAVSRAVQAASPSLPPLVNEIEVINMSLESVEEIDETRLPITPPPSENDTEY